MQRNKVLQGFITTGYIVLMVLLLFSHTYNDIVITTRHSMNLWDFLFDGEILQFYQNNITASGNPYFPVEQSCAYNILVYIVFAVWNIPLVLLEKIANIDVLNSTLCLAYSKLLLVLAMLISGAILDRILKIMQITSENRKMLVFLYFTSTLMISVLFITSQYDIVGLIFQLLGVKAFLENKDKAFFAWFGIAICFKFFALIIFIPLLVLRYKKVWQWIIGVCISIIPYVLTKLPFTFAKTVSDQIVHKRMYYALTESFLFKLIKRMLGYSHAEMNLFVIAYVLIIVWCFCQTIDKKDKRMFGYVLWPLFVSYAAFFSLLDVYPYWSILMAPFLVLVFAMRPEKTYASLILETCGLAALFIYNLVKFEWCYIGNTMKSMLWSHFIVDDSDGYVHLALMLLERSGLYIVFNSIFIGCMIALAVLTYPQNNRVQICVQGKQKNYGDMLLIRFFATAAICFVPILSQFL